MLFFFGIILLIRRLIRLAHCLKTLFKVLSLLWLRSIVWMLHFQTWLSFVLLVHLIHFMLLLISICTRLVWNIKRLGHLGIRYVFNVSLSFCIASRPYFFIASVAVPYICRIIFLRILYSIKTIWIKNLSVCILLHHRWWKNYARLINLSISSINWYLIECPWILLVCYIKQWILISWSISSILLAWLLLKFYCSSQLLIWYSLSISYKNSLIILFKFLLWFSQL